MYNCSLGACYGRCVFMAFRSSCVLVLDPAVIHMEATVVLYLWVCMFQRHAHCNQPFCIFTVVSNLSAYKLQAVMT